MLLWLERIWSLAQSARCQQGTRLGTGCGCTPPLLLWNQLCWHSASPGRVLHQHPAQCSVWAVHQGKSCPRAAHRAEGRVAGALLAHTARVQWYVPWGAVPWPQGPGCDLQRLREHVVGHPWCPCEAGGARARRAHCVPACVQCTHHGLCIYTHTRAHAGRDYDKHPAMMQKALALQMNNAARCRLGYFRWCQK